MKTHEYKLSRVEGVIIDKKRKIKCTTADNNFIIIHDCEELLDPSCDSVN